MGSRVGESDVVIRRRLSRVIMRIECDTNVSAQEAYDVVK